MAGYVSHSSSYPYLGDVVRALTGVDLRLPVPMFGLLVMAAFLAATVAFHSELSRLYAAGRLGTVSTRASPGPVPPQAIAGDFGMIIAIAGIVGARLFSFLEYPDAFLADPVGQIFTRQGFTWYGGLVFATVAGVVYTRRLGLPVTRVMDAIAPSAILGYGIGRIGCEVAGDGDWGIPAVLAAKPAWLPEWCWAQTYDHNILGVEIPLPGVYPTPVYEALMALVAFAVLWSVRRHAHRAGWLFALYLVLAGTERLLIEQIRVNAVIHLFGRAVTQAEIISVLLIALGLAGLVVCGRRRDPSG